jgi:hypothetical protein
MSKVHVTLVRLDAFVMLVPGGNAIPGGKASRNDYTIRVPQGLQEGFGDFGIKAVGGKRLATDEDLNRIPLSLEAHCFRLTAARKTDKRYEREHRNAGYLFT